MDHIELSRLEHLWNELGKIATAESDGETVISEPFLHFPAGTPLLHLWTWFESQNTYFSVAHQLYGIPVILTKTGSSLH